VNLVRTRTAKRLLTLAQNEFTGRLHEYHLKVKQRLTWLAPQTYELRLLELNI